MKFSQVQVKGLNSCFVAEGLDPDRLRFHVSELEAGASAHPPHVHAGAEVFYVLEGNGTVVVEGEPHPLGPNEAIVLDATRAHALTNTGPARMRYVIFISR